MEHESSGVDAAQLAALIADELGGSQPNGPFAGLRTWRDRLDAILCIVTDGVVVLDFMRAVVYVNAPARRILGVDAEAAILGHDLDALYGARRVLRPDGSPLPREELPGGAGFGAREHGGQLLCLQAEDGRAAWAVARVAPIWDAQRCAAAVIVILHEITEARRAEERLRLLADTGALLGTQLDARSTIEATCRLLVPRLADMAAVVLDEPADSHASSARAVDEASLALAARAWWNASRGALAGERARLLAPTEASWPLFAPRMRGAMIAPLVVRGRSLGVLLLLSERAGFDAYDLATASDVAQRAAVAVDSALAYRRSEEANRLLSEADRKKDEFLAILAHEIRNPLTPMLTAAELLRTRTTSADLEVLVPILERQARHLARLVDDLLDVSRIKQGKIALQREPTDVASVLERALETCAPLVESRGHALTLETPEQPLLLDADPLRLTQVFANLIGNAAKYTEPGGRITVRAEGDARRATVVIEDTGVGIDPAFLPHVFELFSQDHGGRLHGLGVGLHMARKLVELHGGAIRAHSHGPGRGSCFTVTLPLAAVGGQPAIIRTEPIGPALLRDVLVVDDDPDVASVLAALLVRLGCEPRVAHDGPSALAAARERAPDLVILDLGMPGMTGYEVAKELRAMRLASTRIVALSGYATEADRRRSREAGCDMHLAKPAPMRVLAALVSGADIIDE